MSKDGRVVFEITEGAVKLAHKNERLEKHGTEDRLACDLTFTWDTDNGALAMFAPSLKSALYEKQSVQGELVDDPSHLTHLKFAALGALKWDAGEITGAKLIFHGATGERSNMVIEGAKVNKYSLTPKEGGTVEIQFRAQVYPDEKQSGKLSKFLTQGLVTLSVVPAEPVEEVGAGAPLT